MSSEFNRKLSDALFSPTTKSANKLNVGSPSAESSNSSSPSVSCEGINPSTEQTDQFLSSFRKAFKSESQAANSPGSHSRWAKIRRASTSARSDVLSTTPASKVASESAHDNVNATEMTACVAVLELRAEDLLPIFEYYCSYGSAYNLNLLKISNFFRFVKDCKLVPSKYATSGELQVLFVRSTRPVSEDAQQSDYLEKYGEHAGKVHDTTCLTFANWLESLCRIAIYRIELREKRRKKLEAKRDLTNAVSSIVQLQRDHLLESKNDSEVGKRNMSEEVDYMLEELILKNASRLESLTEASELLEPGVTDVIRSDLNNLEVMFAYYSDAQKDEEALIGEPELKKFVSDFKLLPKLISKLELFRIFRKVSNGRFNLGFPDFIECIGRFALTAFNKPFFETAYPTNPEKVAGFLQWLEDSGFLLKIIEHDRMRGHGYNGRRLSSPQLLGTRASKGTNLKPSQAMLRRLTTQENRHDVSAAAKQRAHDDAFSFQLSGRSNEIGKSSAKRWGTARAALGKKTSMNESGSDKSTGENGASRPDSGRTSPISMLKVSALYKKPLTLLSSAVKLNAAIAEKQAHIGDEKSPEFRYKELAALTGQDVAMPGTRRYNESLSGDANDKKNVGKKQWNSDVKHAMRSKIATSIFSPHWGEERNLIRSSAALAPFRDALHEVFEYYCFWNNRRTLNFSRLNSSNWAKLCRDCHLILDPRGANMNREDAHSAMEASGCWVTPGEVDVVFVRSATADAQVSGLDHGTLSFDTFQLALARLVRIIDARAGKNLRTYRHEFSSFEDTTSVDHKYYDGTMNERKNGASDEQNDDENKISHTSLAISKLVQLKVLDQKKGEKKEEEKGEGKDENQVDQAEKKMDDNDKEIDAITKIEELEPSEIDDYLLRRSIAAVDSGGAMTYVHKYDEHKISVLDLGEALALVITKCILPHAKRVTCDGYGKDEALRYAKMLVNPKVIAIVEEEHQFTERLFMFYAEIRNGKLPGYTKKKDRFAAMTFSEVVEFSKDFGVDRALATKSELFMCFRACRQDPVSNPNILSYPEFVECLARIALLSFSKPYLDKNHPKPEHKVHGFFGWCRASDGLKRIGTIEWSRGHTRAGLQMTKSLLSGKHVDPDDLLHHGDESIKHRNTQYERIDHTMNIIRQHAAKEIYVEGDINSTGSGYQGGHFDLKSLFEHVDDDGSGSITREEFVEVFAKIVPGISEQEHEDNSNQTIVTKSDLSLLFDFFDADGNGDLEYTEFAYQFYNRRKVSERMKDKQNINGDRHGHIRGSIAPDSGNLLDMDFTDELTGKTALNRKEVARLKAHMRSMAYSWSGLDPLKMFALVDDDHNGLLDKDEFYLVMKRVAGSFRGHDAEEATKRLRKIGGAWTTNFGYKGQSGFADSLTREETDFLFDLIDVDGSGEISVQEFSDFLKESGKKKPGEKWTNALELAEIQDLIENERSRRALIAKKEKIGQKRRYERVRIGESPGLDDYGTSNYLKKTGRKKVTKGVKWSKVETKPPTLGSIVNIEKNVDITSHIQGLDEEVERNMIMKNREKLERASYNQSRSPDNVWERRLQNVPELYKKAPGEDKAIMRRRLAEEEKKRSQLVADYRTYEPMIKWKPVVLSPSKNHYGELVDPKIVEEGKKRREQAQEKMKRNLAKRPMYYGSTPKTKEEEEAAIAKNTKKSIPASERLHAHRHHKAMSKAKNLTKSTSFRRGSFFGYNGGKTEKQTDVTGKDGGSGNGETFSQSSSSSLSELEALAMVDEFSGGAILVTPSNPNGQRRHVTLTSKGKNTPKKEKSSSTKKTSLRKYNNKSSNKGLTSTSGTNATTPKRRSSVIAFGATINLESVNDATAAKEEEGEDALSPRNIKKLRRASIRHDKSMASPENILLDSLRSSDKQFIQQKEEQQKNERRLKRGNSARRGSWFGQSTHDLTQRRKVMNKQKLHGHANEYGVEIRRQKKIHGTGKHNHKHGLFMTKNADHNAHSNHSKKGNYVNPHAYKRHAPKRVVERPAFGSAVPRSPSPTKKDGSTVQVTGKSARRNNKKNRGAASFSTSSRQPPQSPGSPGSPGSPPNLQRSGIRAGWSPAIIRGTSVTAHTHTSSSSVMPHTHRFMTGVVNSSEEDLGKTVNSDELFQRELRS